MLNRRDALRLLAAGAALPLAPRSLLAVLREARALVGSEPAPRTLNAHQNAIVIAMSEMILPRTDTPGATDVGVSQFVDLMLTEWYDDQERSRFLAGLAEVDAHANAMFSHDFVGCSPTQQADILSWLGEKMQEQTDSRQERAMYDISPEPPEDFYLMLRRMTLTAYYTSEAGATDALHFEIIPGRYDGCAPTQPASEAPERK